MGRRRVPVSCLPTSEAPGRGSGRRGGVRPAGGVPRDAPAAPDCGAPRRGRWGVGGADGGWDLSRVRPGLPRDGPDAGRLGRAGEPSAGFPAPPPSSPASPRGVVGFGCLGVALGRAAPDGAQVFLMVSVSRGLAVSLTVVNPRPRRPVGFRGALGSARGGPDGRGVAGCALPPSGSRRGAGSSGAPPAPARLSCSAGCFPRLRVFARTDGRTQQRWRTAPSGSGVRGLPPGGRALPHRLPLPRGASAAAA